MIIKFDAEKHKYYINGTEYPSVTTIIKSCGLINEDFFTEESRLRGAHVHKACELYDNGTLDYDALENEYKPYVDAYINFIEDIEPEWLHIEYRVACTTYMYAGTLDRIGILFNNKCILDIKTGHVSPFTALQTAAYEHAYGKTMKRYALQLKKDGKYKLFTYKDKNDIKVFHSACNFYRWSKNNKLLED